jgi:hypothetical protein
MEFVSMSNLINKLIVMKRLPVFILLLLIFVSCNHSIKDQELESKDLSTEQIQKPEPPAEDKKIEKQNQLFSDSTGTIQQAPANNSSHKIDWDKKIIKTANLKIEVKDFKSFADIAHKAAKQYGGYIANEEQNQSTEKIESIISIKVPVDQFESLLNQLPSNDSKLIERKISTEDVTGEVVDTKSRLQAKEQMRSKYLEFLKQSKNMEDVLKVQSEINEIQEEMESASGRINYLSHQSAYSTINLTFYQPLPGFVPTDKAPNFSYRIIEAFNAGLGFIAEIFIGLISIWTLLLVFIAGWVLYKKKNLSVTTSKQKL